MPTCSKTEDHADRIPDVDYNVTLEFEDCAVVVDQAAVRIGSSVVCDIQLPDGPALNSVVRFEAGVIWIEADEDCELAVNGRACRRMALREGDTISVPGLRIKVCQRSKSSIEADAASLMSDISQLTADELCDRILTEQAAVDEFESNRLAGWHKLMVALKDLSVTEQPLATGSNSKSAISISDDCERLLEQIREMSDIVNNRTLALNECETELVTATTLLQETQDRVSRQIDELLDQIGDVPVANELRASA